MANQYDAAVLASDAQRLEALAKTARSNMLSRTTDRATRLGADGERLSRQARAAESQRADADKLVNAHLAEAATYDARAQALERQSAAATARGDHAGVQEATELAEEAAKARQGAVVARGKSQIAADDGKRLADEAAQLRVQEQAIDTELADMNARLPMTELAVDHLEWHAENARAMADTVRQADDLQAQAAAATTRGDHAAAAELARRAATRRDDADVLAFVRERPPFPLDHTALRAIGVTVTPEDLSAPLPELIDPNSPMNPLAAASNPDDASVARGFGESDIGESIVADTHLAEATFGETSSADSAADDIAASFDAPLFDPPSVDMPSLEAPSFDEPLLADVSLGGFDESPLGPPADTFESPALEGEGAFGDQSTLG